MRLLNHNEVLGITPGLTTYMASTLSFIMSLRSNIEELNKKCTMILNITDSENTSKINEDVVKQLSRTCQGNLSCFAPEKLTVIQKRITKFS